jgi:hypothetical protein
MSYAEFKTMLFDSVSNLDCHTRKKSRTKGTGLKSKLSSAVILLTCIRRIQVSNLGRFCGYVRWPFRTFTQSLMTKSQKQVWALLSQVVWSSWKVTTCQLFCPVTVSSPRNFQKHIKWRTIITSDYIFSAMLWLCLSRHQGYRNFRFCFNLNLINAFLVFSRWPLWHRADTSKYNAKYILPNKCSLLQFDK